MDNKWYNFNDRRVEKIENNIEDSIVTKDAYVLFYKLKNIDVINWDDIYEKKFVNIIDDCFKVYNLNGLNNKNDIQLYFNNNNHMELKEEEDEKEQNNTTSDDEISLNGFVYGKKHFFK